MTPKKILAWTLTVLGSGGVLTLLFWGVPYYLKSTVNDLYAAEVLAAGPASVPAVVVENTAAIKAFGDQLSSVETRLIARDKIQAERDAVIMQYFADKANGR